MENLSNLSHCNPLNEQEDAQPCRAARRTHLAAGAHPSPGRQARGGSSHVKKRDITAGADGAPHILDLGVQPNATPLRLTGRK
jgi:hypothetical protein